MFYRINGTRSADYLAKYKVNIKVPGGLEAGDPIL